HGGADEQQKRDQGKAHGELSAVKRRLQGGWREIEWPDPLIDGPKSIICFLIDDVTERRREWVPLIL
ncbi:MAG: hypothetical protein Q8O63_04075, partial [Hoeflea sp.]|nr:hypothetical protein [Hoeflea sp.]